MQLQEPRLSRAHLRRLRQYYRSAGWPCQDNVEVELLTAGLVTRVSDFAGHESIRVTDAGISALRRYLDDNRRLRDAHESLVGRVAAQLVCDGRLVFRGLKLRAECGGRWALTHPDVFSIRQTNVAAYVHPAVHEIKVRRSDLLADLKNPAKRGAYQAIAREFWYVIADGIADASEIPEDCGVVIACSDRLTTARPSPYRAVSLRIDQWVALARARCEAVDVEFSQLELGDEADDHLSGPASEHPHG